MAQSERERAIAIKEAHNIAASEAYFEVRAAIVHPQPHTIFDAAFSRGWDAAMRVMEAEPPAERKPLTEEMLDDMADRNFTLGNNLTPYQWRHFARAIERAHGIGD